MFGRPVAPLYVPVPVPVPVIAQMPLVVAQANCAVGPGSSINSKASDQPAASSLLVIARFDEIVRLTGGTVACAAVGVPPVQVKTRSGSSSARPSIRRLAVSLAAAEHCTPLTCDHAAPEKATRRIR